MNSIQDRLSEVRSRIESAAAASGRSAQAIKLIAVSKYRTREEISTAIGCGQAAFGENTIQEALPKIRDFSDVPLEWHFIGHLQTNKAKFLPGTFSWLHSLDSIRLASRLSAFTHPDSPLHTLIQVNITGEAGQFGIAPDKIFQFADELLEGDHANLKPDGLMAIGPRGAGEGILHRYFASLRLLQEACADRFGKEHFSELSMGMSNDFEAAILEGATMVRLGTAIFGPRKQTANQDVAKLRPGS